VNIGAPWPTRAEAEARVLRMQTKLHEWRSAILTVGLMICSTSSTTRRARGGLASGQGQQREAVRRVDGCADRRHRRGGTARSTARGPQSAAVHAAARPGADDPQTRRQAAPVGDRNRAGPHRASGPEAGAGADLRGGVPPRSYGFRPKRRAEDAIASSSNLKTRRRCFDRSTHSCSLATAPSG
jgi:hypothetical protein